MIAKHIHYDGRRSYYVNKLRHQQYKTGCTIDAILVSHRTPERALAPILESFSRVWEDKLGKGLSKIVGACCLDFGVRDSYVKYGCFVCRAWTKQSCGHGCVPIRFVPFVNRGCANSRAMKWQIPSFRNL